MEFGPLAVVPGPAVGLDAQATGTLRIADDCVTLESGSRSWLVVWPADRTAWDAARKAVRFANDERVDERVVEALDGQQVSLGGGGTDGQAHLAGDAWVESVAWIDEPDEGRPTRYPWWVNAVQLRE